MAEIKNLYLILNLILKAVLIERNKKQIKMIVKSK
jgi:hypothetical protein